jgi:predicted ABC-type sugar transport system permease subunit
MTKRTRIAVSVGLLAMSVTAVAAAASHTGADTASAPAALLTGALVCVVLTLLVWSDELDRSSVRRSRADQQRRR